MLESIHNVFTWFLSVLIVGNNAVKGRGQTVLNVGQTVLKCN